MSFDFARGRPPSVSMERSIYVARSLYRSLAVFGGSCVWGELGVDVWVKRCTHDDAIGLRRISRLILLK